MLLGWAGVLHAERRRLPLVCSYHTRAARYALYCRLGVAEGLVWAIGRQSALVGFGATATMRFSSRPW